MRGTWRFEGSQSLEPVLGSCGCSACALPWQGVLPCNGRAATVGTGGRYSSCGSLAGSRALAAGPAHYKCSRVLNCRACRLCGCIHITWRLRPAAREAASLSQQPKGRAKPCTSRSLKFLLGHSKIRICISDPSLRPTLLVPAPCSRRWQATSLHSCGVARAAARRMSVVQAVGRAGAAKETAPAPPACSRLLACPAVLQGLFVPLEGRSLGPQGQTAHTSRSSLDDGRAPTIGSSKSSKIYGSICRTDWQTMALQRERRAQEAAFCAAWQGRHCSTPRISFVCA